MSEAIVAPAIWPGAPLAVQPGDLTRFAPMGMNLGVAPIVRPYDTLEDAFSATNYYSPQARGNDPIRDAPVTDAAGGVVYFENSIGDERLAALLQILEIPQSDQSFALFRAESPNAIADRYLTQIRVVQPSALVALYGAQPVPELTVQPLNIGAAIAAYLAAECERWGTNMGASALRGTFGGDGDWAKERLCFGLMVENSYHGVFRVWSRAWLVTK